ncbi:MAG: hypothetical protein HRT64_06140, partial [Erythrobacter sp.]|nr:hypothetical protein [Erythrobacter sp.]
MKHLFVVTYGRSGSTVLQKLLNSIEGYCIRGENGGIVQDLAAAARTLERTQAQFGEFDKSTGHPWYGLSEIEPGAFATTLAESF